MHHDWAELDYMVSEVYTKAIGDISQPWQSNLIPPSGHPVSREIVKQHALGCIRS